MDEMNDKAIESSESGDTAEVETEKVKTELTAEEPTVATPIAEPEIDWQDRCLRLAAEFDNFRKRTVREYAQIIKNAEEQLITELTGVLDNLERALDPEHRNAKTDEFVKGIELIYGQFKMILEKRGLVRMKVVGEPFDPEKHDALLQVESVDIQEGYVTQEVAPGYLLGDKVIRHAKVTVSRGPTENDEQGQAPEPQENM